MRILLLVFVGLSSVFGAIQHDIPMTCYPGPMGMNFSVNPPQMIPWTNLYDIPINPCGPCVEPVDAMVDGVSVPFPDKYSSAALSPYGSLNYRIYDDSQPERLVKLTFDLYNVKPGLVITAWNSMFFPFIGPTPDPIFGYSTPEFPFVDADAAVSMPTCKSNQAFTNGLDDADIPYRFTYMGNNHYRTVIDLDYRPENANTTPLRNGRSDVTQDSVKRPEGNQTKGWMKEVQAIGSDFLRVVNQTTGFQVLDDNGFPVLMRSPVGVSMYAVTVHNDDQTHGINPGVATPPAPNVPWTVGSTFLFGVFDVRFLLTGNPSPPVLEC